MTDEHNSEIKQSGKRGPDKRRFAEEFIIDLNRTQAAIRAGYSEKTAGSQGSRLLKDVEVQELIQELVEARSKRTGVTQDMVIREYAKIAFANIDDFVTINNDGMADIDLSAVTRDQMAALSEISTDKLTSDDVAVVMRNKIKMASKQAALDSLARHLGMFVDKSERTHKFKRAEDMTDEELDHFIAGEE